MCVYALSSSTPGYVSANKPELESKAKLFIPRVIEIQQGI